jgi:hypothetical protein
MSSGSIDMGSQVDEHLEHGAVQDGNLLVVLRQGSVAHPDFLQPRLEPEDPLDYGNL